jgi:hypothetical protein
LSRERFHVVLLDIGLEGLRTVRAEKFGELVFDERHDGLWFVRPESVAELVQYECAAWIRHLRARL